MPLLHTVVEGRGDTLEGDNEKTAAIMMVLYDHLVYPSVYILNKDVGLVSQIIKQVSAIETLLHAR